MVPNQGLIIQSPPAKKISERAIAVIVIVIAAVAICAVAIATILATPVNPADLRANLRYSTSQEASGLGSGGTVAVSGTIYNYGGVSGGGTVNLQVYDGTNWHYYSVPTGVVIAGGSVAFDYTVHLKSLNTGSVQVKYTITTG